MNRFPTLHLDFSPCIDLMYHVFSYCLTPASLGKGGRGSRTILLSGVNYSLHFSRRWISGWRSLLSPLSPHYHCSQPVSPLPSFLLAFFFLCYHRKASTCSCTPRGMPVRTGGRGGAGKVRSHCAESEKSNSNWEIGQDYIEMNLMFRDRLPVDKLSRQNAHIYLPKWQPHYFRNILFGSWTYSSFLFACESQNLMRIPFYSKYSRKSDMRACLVFTVGTKLAWLKLVFRCKCPCVYGFPDTLRRYFPCCCLGERGVFNPDFMSTPGFG